MKLNHPAPRVLELPNGRFVLGWIGDRGLIYSWGSDGTQPVIVFDTKDAIGSHAYVKTYASGAMALIAARKAWRERLELQHLGCSIVQEHGLSGPGPSRYGWWAVSPAGHRLFLGSSLSYAVGVTDRDV